MEMTLDLVGSLGNEHSFLIKEIGQKHGRKLIEDKINHATKELAQWNFDEKMELFNEISHSIGYFTRVRKDYEGYTLSYEVYNCPFKEQASAHPEQVCTMHTAFLEGAFKTLFQVTEFKQTENMTKNCPSCQYHICIMN
ncbi:methanogen output domain 1-containing protein [Bacillus coahuilensis]|nr:methanogen output domain 1-containing protein [Bacillus coahuilensis]